MVKRTIKQHHSPHILLWIAIIVAIIAFGIGVYIVITMQQQQQQHKQPQVIIVQTPQNPHQIQMIKPDLYPEPVTRSRYGNLQDRGGQIGPIQQIGILTADGGSSSSAAPDRTIIPLYGRELDPRRSKWNYYTRTDGANPVQVPVRVGNRSCDDDRNGCTQLFSDDSVHVPALGRSFTATVYKQSM